jgi:hypothetical protein
MPSLRYEEDLAGHADVVWSVDSKDDQLKAFIRYRDGRYEEVTWCPQPGSQQIFLNCPIYEALYEGTRGPGKTDALLMDFAQYVGRGFGAEWRGILFRETYPQLKDVIAKSLKWFKRVWPDARYNKSEHYWEWSTGEQLIFSFMSNPEDYWNYHGHAYPWIGWEELTNWPDPQCYLRMMSCCRSSVKNIPRRYRSTANPYGVGHNWVKDRFRLPVPAKKYIGPVIKDSRNKEGDLEPPRVAIRGTLDENKVLLHADPEYISRIRAAARNPQELKAWVHGDWNIVAGGMFDDVYNDRFNIVPNIPFDKIPKTWRIDRAYDHGQSKPFSVGWYAESNGEPIEWEGQLFGYIPGDLFRIAEWYGWNFSPNEGVRMNGERIAQGILDRESDWGLLGRVKPGPADNSIFDDYDPKKSVAGDMAKKGVTWRKSNKKPGSRKQGWQRMRTMLQNAHKRPGLAREAEGFFVFDRCDQWKRTVPVLPRSHKDLDDVNTDAEDHIGDENRYRIMFKKIDAQMGDF